MTALDERCLNILERILSAVSVMFERVDAANVYRTIADVVTDILGFDRVNILIYNPETGMLEAKESRGTTEPLDRIKVPADKRSGVVYKAFSEKKVYWVEDAAKHFPPEWRLQPPWSEIKALRSRSFILAPLVAFGKPVGVIGIDKYIKREPITKEEALVVEMFAQLSSRVLERAMREEEVERLSREAEEKGRELEERERLLEEQREVLREVTSEAVSELKVLSQVVDRIRDEGRQLEDGFNQLMEHVKQIDFVVKSVDDVANKTNLLALNAAIEAARAGEHGKGFAVVADEVRKLAQKSKKDSSEIATALRNIREATDNFFKFINSLNQRIREQEEVIAKISDTVRKVEEVMGG